MLSPMNWFKKRPVAQQVIMATIMEEQQEESVISEVSRERSKREVFFEELKPYVYCIFCSFCIAGFSVISKISLNYGMSQYLLLVYGQVVGCFTTAILAFLFERNNTSKITLPILRDIIIVGIMGGLARTLYFQGLEYVSPAFASAMGNLIPPLTFILAVLCRMEKLEISRHSTQAKIVGSLVAFGGAVLMTLYKGIVVVSFHRNKSHHSENKKVFLHGENWIKGCIFLFLAYLVSAAFYVLQSSTIKKYPVPLKFTLYSNLVATLFVIIMAVIQDHKAYSWRLPWNIALLGPVYGGIVIIGLTLYVQLLVTRKRGPVFTTAFMPLSTIIAAFMGLFILGDALYLGGVLGATLIFIGLYAILWGKEKENKKMLELTISNQSIETKSDQAMEIKVEK